MIRPPTKEQLATMIFWMAIEYEYATVLTYAPQGPIFKQRDCYYHTIRNGMLLLDQGYYV